MAESLIEAAQEIAALAADMNRNDEKAQSLASRAEELQTSIREQGQTAADLEETISGKATAAHQLSTDLGEIVEKYIELSDEKAGPASYAKDQVDLIEGMMYTANAHREEVQEKIDQAAQLLKEAGEEAVSMSQVLTEAQAKAEEALSGLND